MNSIQKIEQCINNCNDRLSYCRGDKCKRYETSCLNNCREIESEGLNYVIECGKENNCNRFDLDCFKNNKDNIINCCNDKCVSSQGIDCDEGCLDFYDFLFKENYENITLYNHFLEIIFLILFVISFFIFLKMN